MTKPGLALTLLILLSQCLPALAAENAGQYELQIRPSICVSYASDEPCTMLLQISWRGGSLQTVCLNTAGNGIFLACWEGEYSGSLELPFDNAGNVVYQLVSMQNNRVLAQASVQVISRDLRDTHRRRRHVWSIL